jgi:hypothetical protein
MRVSFSAVAALGLAIAPTAFAGLIPLPTGPKPGFEVFSVDNKGGGWVIHHMPGRGDSLWGCKDVTAVEDCVQVFFSEWKTGTSMNMIHVTDKSQKAWFVLNAPAMGDYLFACSDPENAPACTLVDLELRPPMAQYERVWPGYDCKFECGDKGPCCGDVLPETDTRRLIEVAEKGDMWLQAKMAIGGPVNLYACKTLESAPVCTLTIPNWMAVDREDLGFKTLEDIEHENPDETITYGPGVLVGKMEEESVAYEAGIREGMVITKVGPFDVSRAKHARYVMLQYIAETSVTLTMEDGKTYDLKIRRKPKKEK